MLSNKSRASLPHLTVAAIVKKDQHYLVVKEFQDGKAVLNQPAGHVENNETLQQAVIRETLEESGWRVEPKGIVGLYSFTPFVGADTYHRVAIYCEAIEKVTDALDPDIASAHWMTVGELTSQTLRSPLVLQCIEDFERGQNFPLEIICNHHISPNSG